MGGLPLHGGGRGVDALSHARLLRGGWGVVPQRRGTGAGALREQRAALPRVCLVGWSADAARRAGPGADAGRAGADAWDGWRLGPGEAGGGAPSRERRAGGGAVAVLDGGPLLREPGCAATQAGDAQPRARARRLRSAATGAHTGPARGRHDDGGVASPRGEGVRPWIS